MRTRPSSLLARLRLWRDAALTAAAFGLVLAAVAGVGPFGGPREATGGVMEDPALLASDQGPSPSKLADLSR